MNRLTAAYSTNDKEPRGFAAMDRPTGEILYRRAARHSRRVRVLRVALPVALTFGLVVTIIMVWYNPLRMLSTLPTR